MVEPGFEPSAQTSDNEPWGLKAVRQKGALLWRQREMEDSALFFQGLILSQTLLLHPGVV